MLSTRLLRCLPWGTAALLASVCCAQVMQAPGTMPDGRPGPYPGRAPVPSASSPGPTHDAAHDRVSSTPDQSPSSAVVKTGAAAVAPAASASSEPTTLPSLLDQPAQPAQVTLTSDHLSVDARNSSLSQILHEVATSSGMTIDGLGKDQRIFGIYGPGNPREVLSDLLDGAGYNVLMIGDSSLGAPRELILSARSDAPIPSSPAKPAAEPEETVDDTPPNIPPPPELPMPTVTPANVPPMPNANGQVKTPQQIYEEMQRLHQQQQQPQ